MELFSDRGSTPLASTKKAPIKPQGFGGLSLLISAHYSFFRDAIYNLYEIWYCTLEAKFCTRVCTQ